MNRIGFYLCVFDNSNSNPLFHEEQPPAIGSLQVKTFTKKNNQQ